MSKGHKTAHAQSSNPIGLMSPAGEDRCDPPAVDPPSPALMEALRRYDRHRQAVVAERQGPKKQPSETPSEVFVKLAREETDLSNGEKRSILTCLGGRYTVWRDFLNPKRWRWALRLWPDNDMGTASHGAGTLRECIEACLLHFIEHNPGVKIPVE